MILVSLREKLAASGKPQDEIDYANYCKDVVVTSVLQGKMLNMQIG